MAVFGTNGAGDSTPFVRYRSIIDDWEAFQQALERPLPAALWTNMLKASPGRLARLLPAEGIPLEPLPWRPGGFKLLVHDAKPGNHWGFLGGLYHVQEEVSLLPVLLLDPRPGDRVLDLCAAPGNKTAQIAVAMGNRGTVVANDRDYYRIRAIHHMMERLGILNTSTTLFDGANYPKGAGLFDKILVDVPCTCEGTVRKSPELALDPTGGLSRKMSGGQKALLRKAIQLCKPGGRIVYSSCTYAPEENEAVIDALLREVGRHVVRLVPARVEGFHTSEGLKAWDGETFDESLRLAMRIWPHQNDTGGFFVAVLEKGNGNESAGEEDTQGSAEAGERRGRRPNRMGCPLRPGRLQDPGSRSWRRGSACPGATSTATPFFRGLPGICAWSTGTIAHPSNRNRNPRASSSCEPSPPGSRSSPRLQPCSSGERPRATRSTWMRSRFEPTSNGRTSTSVRTRYGLARASAMCSSATRESSSG